MKNLFDYATSELSQDAFLCWLFENYDCENEIVKEAAHALLGEMTGLEELKVGTVTNLKTDRQVNHTDIVVSFSHDGKRHILVIEDKVFSGEHEQFETYPEKIKSKEEYRDVQKDFFHFTFYKTDIENNAEKERATSTWKLFYLNDIYDFFNCFPISNCLIFDQYKEHIAELY